MKKLVTHHGKFHADDVFSTAWLKIIYKDVQIIRINRDEIYKYKNNAEYFMYDIGNGKYDHHSKECKEYRPNGNPYAAFGKIVRDTYKLVGFDKKTYLLFDNLFVSPIDTVDNNGPNAAISQHSDIVRAMNQEDLYGATQENAFLKAVEYAEFVLNVMINKFLADKELERKTKEIALQNKGKDIVILDKFYPTNPFKKFGSKFIIYPDFDHWNCNATDQENLRITNKTLDNLIFRHETGSFATFRTKDSAIRAAKLSLGRP